VYSKANEHQRPASSSNERLRPWVQWKERMNNGGRPEYRSSRPTVNRNMFQSCWELGGVVLEAQAHVHFHPASAAWARLNSRCVPNRPCLRQVHDRVHFAREDENRRDGISHDQHARTGEPGCKVMPLHTRQYRVNELPRTNAMNQNPWCCLLPGNEGKATTQRLSSDR